MRKVVVQEFVTLNGLAAGPQGNLDFVPASTQGDQAFGRDQLAFIDMVDTILLGRVTYGMLAAYWPHVTAGAEKAFADELNATPKVVFSRTLDRAPWGTWNEARIVSGALPDEVTKLKGQAGKDIAVWGSLSLVPSLIKAGLVDEYRVVVCPAVLGGGRALFNESPSITMTLMNVNTLDRGGCIAVPAPHGRPGEPAAKASEGCCDGPTQIDAGLSGERGRIPRRSKEVTGATRNHQRFSTSAATRA